MRESDFAGANLWQADLSQANLIGARFYHAYLVEADLREADLEQTNFTWAVLYGANLQEAYISHTIFGDVDLSHVKGLDELHYRYPPIIDLYTLARSSGRLSETFLRQAGINSTIIPSLLALFHSSGNADSVWFSEIEPSDPWLANAQLQEPPEAIMP